MTNSYEKIIDNMQWSYSRLTTFEQCKYGFYLNYILKDFDEYPIESNFYAEVGIYVHKILALIFEGKLNIEDASTYYIKHFKENVLSKVKKSSMDKTYETCADYFAEVDFDWLKKYEILGVELKTQFKIKKYNFVGYIDLLLRDKENGQIIIVDNKSSGYPFKSDGTLKSNQKKSFDKYKKQMYLYSYGVKEMFGEFPKKIVWNHFKDGGKFASIPFIKKDCEKAIKWFLNTIKDIEQEKEFPANQDYFYCETLCNFRNSCEYKQIKKWGK